jgi:lysozyme
MKKTSTNRRKKSNPLAVPGIDVSHFQGVIDFDRVAKDQAGIQYVFIKATEGAATIDPNFIKNRTNARAAGLKTGAYHFFHPNRTADAQADNIRKTLDAIAFDGSTERLAIDIEIAIDKGTREVNTLVKERLAADIIREGNPATLKSPSQAMSPNQKATVDPKNTLANQINDLLTSMSQSSQLKGHLPFIYCGPKFWNNNIDVHYLNDIFANYPLWVSHYTTASAPTIPEPWNSSGKSWSIWQYTDRGITVDGINGDVDCNWVLSW